MPHQIYFKSEEHRERFLQIIIASGKFDHQILDPEYGAAYYILTESVGTWRKASIYIDHGIDFAEMLADADFSGGLSVLIKWAANLFNGTMHIDPLELLRLDERNFRLALTSLVVRRSRLCLNDFQSGRIMVDGSISSGTLQ